ncbi:MAG: phosphoglucosamine mutase [candidate division WOR-3 bacterium]
MIIKSISGIRGIVDKEFNPLVVLNFAAKFGEFMGNKIVVGRDSRKSGLAFKNAVISGLLGVGVDVIDLDLVPTPTLLYNVKKLKASGGIIVTASHNPSSWNALKLVSSSGEFLNEEEANKFFGMEGEEILWEIGENYGELDIDKLAVERHIEGVVRALRMDSNLMKKRKFKVVLDCVNGGASFAFQDFLNFLGVEVYPLFCDGNGIFLRNPEPRKENVKELANKVKEIGADIGFATDPDGDRILIVLENGKPISEEYTITLAVKAILSKNKGPVVVNLSTTKSVEDVAARAGVPFYRSPVGEANVIKVMKEKKAIIGGEGNGGVIDPKVHYARDGMVAMGLILRYLFEEERPISSIFEELPRYEMVKEAIKMESEADARRVLERIKERTKEKNLDLTDGIRFGEDNYWVHIRRSGTEPVLRIIAEATTINKAKEIVELVKEKGNIKCVGL